MFGTWRGSLNGVEGPHDGWLVILFSLVALAGVGSLARGGRLGVVLVFGCAAANVYFAVSDLVDDREIFGGLGGWGIWLTVAAGLLAAGTAVAVRVQRK